MKNLIIIIFTSSVFLVNANATTSVECLTIKTLAISLETLPLLNDYQITSSEGFFENNNRNVRIGHILDKVRTEGLEQILSNDTNKILFNRFKADLNAAIQGGSWPNGVVCMNTQARKIDTALNSLMVLKDIVCK